MVAVMAVLALLLSAAIRGLGDPSAQARRAATDCVVSLVEQARAEAITSHRVVVLALAEPGTPPASDERCRLGLFKINEWPADPATLDGILLGRWQVLPVGAVILPSPAGGLRNPRDEPATTIRFLAGKQPLQGSFHILAFTPRGTLQWPAGSDPLVLRIAEGSYRNGQAVANNRGLAENLVGVGRLTARPYQFDR